MTRKFSLLAALLFFAAWSAPAAPSSVKVGAFPQMTASKFVIGGGAEVTGLARCGDRVLALAGELYEFDGEGWTERDRSLLPPDCQMGPASTRAVEADLPGLLRGLAIKKLKSAPPAPRSRIRDAAGNELAATGRGLCLSTDGAHHLLNGRVSGLPYNDALSLAARQDVLWVGTEMGAARWDGVEWRYLQGRQHLLDDKVIAVEIGEDGEAWLATPGGVSRIEFKMMTLEEKAEHMLRATRERHVRYNLVSDSRLTIPGDLSTNQVKTSDNDGLWTAMYVAAEAYRYAVTKDPEARQFARDSLSALMFLETVNEIPGFVSRSFARPREPHCKGEWDHITSDGEWRWKGDTSSDEIVGHFYAYSIYYDLVADEHEKEEIRKKVRLITDYILDNDLYLIDADGKPTTWGKWNFKGLRRFRPDRGLNSLEILSHLKVAHHITGDEKYQQAYLELALKYDYAKFTVRQKLNIPPEINHSDDELAFLSYYPLLKYEKDPKLLEYYHASLRRSFEIERPEKCPLWNFIYGAVMPPGEDFGLEDAVWTLQRISLDLVRWDHVNSKRDDLRVRIMPGRLGEKQATIVLPPDERSTMKWNGNPYALDTGQGGKNEEAGTFWLLPYWMGRHYGFIVED